MTPLRSLSFAVVGAFGVSAFLLGGLGSADEPAPPPGTYTPQPHFHDYWGDRSDVIVFDAQLEFEADPLGDGPDGCKAPFVKAFDLETDGDDVAAPHATPVNPLTNRADTVFRGANRLDVTLVELDGATPLPSVVFFRYQPSNLNYFLPANGCGFALAPGQTMQIPVSVGAADPAHQIFVSGWAFEAASLLGGRFELRITAHRGFGPTLDPAHPDLYGEADTFDLGCIVAEVDRQVTVWTPSHPLLNHSPSEPLADIRWAAGRIVPLLTERVEVTLDYASNGLAAPTTELDVWFHGANTHRLERLTQDPAQPGLYVIEDPHGALVDPPYEFETQWEFLLVPRSAPALDVPQGPATSEGFIAVGEFEGFYRLCGTAFRDPDAVLV